MNSGLTFLQLQVSGAATQHGALVDALAAHADAATDDRVRSLCAMHVAHMRHHQRLLEELERELGGASPGAGGVAGAVRRLAEGAVNVARELADVAPVDDYARLMGDLALARQCEVTFKVFRDAGRTLGLTALSTLGEVAERHHDQFAAEAGRLLQQLFVERARGAAEFVQSTTTSGASAEPTADAPRPDFPAI